MGEPNGSYMQNSAAIDEKAFEDNEEIKCGPKNNEGVYPEGSPSLRNKLKMAEEIPVPKKPTRITI